METSNQQLQQRDALLNSVNAAAQCLVANDDLAQAIPEALKILGEGTQQDRVYVFENLLDPETKEILWTLPYEWTTPGIPDSPVVADALPLAMNAFPLHLVEPASRGQVVKFLTRDLGGIARDVNVAGQTQSLVAVPVSVAGQWWGVLGFDDCTTERVWSDAEIAVLETAATCIGNAIERDRNQKQKEAAAQARAAELEAHNRVLAGRDRILEAAAKAANILLTVQDFDRAVDTALQIVGEAVDTDRVGIVEHLEDPSETSLGRWQVAYEWTSPHPHSVSQINHPELMRGTYEGAEEIYALHLKGEGFSLTIDELSEPFRSGQKEVGVKSMHSIPILLQGSHWGAVTFDDCRVTRRWTDVEITVLKTIADCIGSAIERERLRDAERRSREAREAAERNVLLEREQAARDRVTELVKANDVIKETLDTLATEPELERFLGYVLQAIAQQFNAPLLEYWRHEDETAYLELAVVNGEILVSEKLAGHHGVEGFPVPPPLIHNEKLLHRTQHIEAEFSLNNSFTAPIAHNVWAWCKQHGVTHPVDKAINFPVILGDQSYGAIAVLLSEGQTFSEHSVQLGYALTNQVALAVQLTQLAEESRQSAIVQEREQAAQNRVAELAKANDVLKETLDTLATEPELGRFIGYVLQAASQQFNAPLVEYWRHSEQSMAYIEQAAVQGEIVTAEQLAGHPGLEGFAVPSELVNEEQLQERLTHFLIDDLAADPLVAEVYPRLLSWCEPRGVSPHREANIPVTLGGTSFGSLVIYLPQSQQFSDEKIELGYALAHQMSLAIQLTRLAEETKQVAVLEERDRISQQRAIELSQVNNVLKDSLNRLASEHDLDVFLGYVVDTINQQVGAAAGHVFLHDPKTDTLSQRLSVRFGQMAIGAAEHDPPIFHAPVPADITPAYARMCESREIILASMDGDEPLFWPGTLEWHRQMGHQEAAALALRAGDRAIGWLGLAFTDKNSLTPEEKELIFALADQAGLAIQLAQLAEETKQTAVIKEREQFAQTRATELETHNQVLEKRDRILEATAAAANVMLTASDFDSSIDTALQIVGEGLDVDRILLGEHFDAVSDQEFGYFQFLHEWASPGTSLQTEHPELVRIGDSGIEYVVQMLRNDKIFGGIIDELAEPFRSGQLELGVKSTYSIPIKADSNFWGIIALDDCHHLTRRSEAELEALKTLANCIGNAIDRDRIRQERDAAAHAHAVELKSHNLVLEKRDRILEATASAANVMLTANDFDSAINTALQIVGEGLEVDRISLGEHFEATSAKEPGHHYFLYEWNTPGIPRQSDHPELARISDSGMELAIDALRRGDAFGGIVDGLPEPFRSAQLELGVLSTYAIPIHVDSNFWGVVAFDDCHQLTHRSEAELEALKTLANCIGNAI
ncbi:MAG: GAF domain-containing protein, partial [Cyanobacteria bacterium P01_A01_bin.17]